MEDSYREIGVAADAGDSKKLSQLLKFNRMKTSKKLQKEQSLFKLSSSSRPINDILDILKQRISSFNTNNEGGSSAPSSKETLSFHQALRALLMVPPCYEAPWLTVFHIVSDLPVLFRRRGNNNHDRTMIYETISLLEDFFGQVVISRVSNVIDDEDNNSSSCVRKRSRRRSPSEKDESIMEDSLSTESEATAPLSGSVGDWFFRIFQVLLDAIFSLQPSEAAANATTNRRDHHISIRSHDGMDDNNNSIRLVLSKFVETILSTARRFDKPIYSSMCAALVTYKPHPSKCSTWLEILDVIVLPSSFLQIDGEDDNDDQYDVETIQKTLYSQITNTNQQTNIPVHDLQRILSISFNQGLLETETSMIRRREKWLEIAFLILTVASTSDCYGDGDVYNELEDYFIRQLANVSKSEINNFFLEGSKSLFLRGGSDCTTSTKIPRWMFLNVALGSTCASQHSNVDRVSRLVFRAMSKTVPAAANDNTIQTCCLLIQDILFGPNRDSALEKSSILSGDVWNMDGMGLVQATESILYTGIGIFTDKETSEDIDCLSRAGKLILDSIGLGGSTKGCREAGSGVARRAVRALDVATRMSNISLPDVFGHRAALLILIIVSTVIYVEFPSLRSKVVGVMTKEFASEPQDHNVDSSARGYCAAATTDLLVRSSKQHATHHGIPRIDLVPLMELLRIPVRHEVFGQLIITLSSVPDARELILESSKRMFQQQFARYWDSTVESKDRVSESLLRNCLEALLELVRIEKWGVCEMSAWKLLSECIVLNEPHLSLNHRRWLYRQIQSLVDSEELSLEGAEHFLRAAIVRLSLFFSEETPKSRFQFVLERILISDEQAGEDVPLLLHLILSLLIYLSSHEPHDESNSTLLTEGRASILRSILAFNDQPDFEKHPCFAKFIISCKSHKYEKVDFAIYCSASISLISCILEYLMRPHQSRTTNRGSRQPARSYSQKETINSICMLEAKSLRSVSTSQCGESEIPSWLQHKISSTKSFGSNSSRTVLCSSLELFDFMIEILFKPGLPRQKPKRKVKSFSKLITRGVGEILRNKRNLGQLFKVEGDAEDLGLETCSRTAHSFLNISLTALKGVTAGDLGLVEAEDILSPILEYCSGLSALPEDEDVAVRDGPDVLDCVWSLYRDLCSEKSAVNFIKYLDDHLNEGANVIQGQECICPLSSISTWQDIDDCVFEVRSRTLKALKRCLSLMAYNPTKQKDWKTLMTGNHFELLVGMLESLTNDLNIGLKGVSGGIGPELYVAYLEAIEECASLIFELSLTKTRSNTSPSVFLGISVTLEDIMSKNSLQFFDLFRSSFILATTVFPMFYRNAIRQGTMQLQRSGDEFTRMRDSHEKFLSNVFSECLEILRRWSTLRDPESYPWVDIATIKHMNGKGEAVIPTNGNSQSMVEETLASTGASQVSHESSRRSRDTHPEGDDVQNSCFLRLQSKEMWSWALSCTMIFLEDQWIQSVHAIRPSEGLLQCAKRKNLSLGDRAAFFNHRRSELYLCCERAATFLYSNVGSRSDNAREQSIIALPAMNLPSAPRQRLCSVLHRMSEAVNICVETIHRCLQDSSDVLHDSIPFHEAMCCLSAWSSHEAGQSSICEGIPSWVSLLKRKRPPGEAAHKRDDILVLKSKLRKVESDHHSITSGLVRLRNFLRETQFDGRTSALFERFYVGGVHEMIRLLSSNICLLEKTMPPSDEVESVPRFPETQSQNEKKRRRKSTGRPRKRIRPRSRNKVVDMFLRQNQGADDSEPVDAFVDLEDFLVDG